MNMKKKIDLNYTFEYEQWYRVVSLNFTHLYIHIDYILLCALSGKG